MKILVVDDEHKIASSVKKGLEQESFIVDVAFDGEAGFDLASSEEYNVIILDVMMPKMTGFEICQKLREQNNHVPILLLTAKGMLGDKIEGFNSGADDYLPKPFAFEELLARVRALSRRPQKVIKEVLTVGDLSLNTKSFEVIRQNNQISLSQKEYALLEYLMRHPNQILTKDQIIQHVWEYDSDVLPNTVEVYIGYLRNKIDKPFKNLPPLLQTVRGFGYKIKGEKIQ
jgi:DNA-binding response OmpR family regulator